MKILHVVPTYLPAVRYGGPIYSVHGLCKSLAKLGHEMHVFTTNVDGKSNSDVPIGVPVEKDGVHVWYFPSQIARRLYFSPSMQKALEAKIENFQLVHLHSIYLWPTWMTARLCEKKNIPYIIAPRGMLIKDLIAQKSYWKKTFWIKFIERHSLEKASAIHATSLLEENEMRKFGFEYPRIFVVPNGIDITSKNTASNKMLDSITKYLEEKPFILFLGRINWKKGLDRLIAAMRYVRDARLIIAGNDEDGYKEKLEKLAEENEVSNRILFSGPIYGIDKEELLQAAKIFVLPSYSENFANSVLEAMSAGCPVIVTPQVGLADIVEKEQVGLVVDGDPKTLGESINTLLLDDERRKKMGIAGQRVVRDQFQWSAIAVQMENLYNQILRDKVSR